MPTRREGGAMLASGAKLRTQGEQPAVDVVLRSFGGMDLRVPREAVNENEFAWLEEVIPVGPGNLSMQKGPGAALATVLGETGPPSYTRRWANNSVEYGLAIWSNSGNAWVGILSGPSTWTKIATGNFTSGKTAATEWNNQGLLIIDSVNGYYDWNVTAANTLTGTPTGVVNPFLNTTTSPTVAGNSAQVGILYVNDTGAGTGATVGVSLSCTAVSVYAGGTGYVVGDVVTATTGSLTTNGAAPVGDINQPLVVRVNSVVGGVVQSVSILNPGYYQICPDKATGAAPWAFTMGGGAGTGLKLTASWRFVDPFIIAAGSGYVAPFITRDPGTGIAVAAPWFTIGTGLIRGQAIAVYAGRVWIAVGRTLQFTDVNSYTSFAGAGGSATINDDTLVGNITALVAANSYLYIFGVTSIDLLSNVQVNGGVTSFSRVNITPSIGTALARSLFALDRTVGFVNPAGFWLLAGSTPQKISDQLDALFPVIDFTQPVYGGQVVLAGKLCPAMLVTFTDNFVSGGAVRAGLFIRYENRWFFSAQTPAAGQYLKGLISSSVGNGLANLFGWYNNSIYPLFSAANTNPWLLTTKLFDLSEAMRDKQALLAAVGAVVNGAATPGITVTISELTGETATQVAQVPPEPANQSGYQLYVGAANTGGGKYLGLKVTGNANTSQIRLLALKAENTREW